MCRDINNRLRRLHTLTTTHLAAVLLIGLLLDLDWNEWFVAMLFGIALDLDHLFAAPEYIGRNGLSAILRPTWDDGTGFAWRSLLHDPVGAFVVIPLSVGWRMLIPLVFWSSHLSIDYLQSATLAHSALVESVFMGAVCSAILAIGYRRWSVAHGESGFVRFVRYVGAEVKSAVSGTRKTTRGSAGRT